MELFLTHNERLRINLKFLHKNQEKTPRRVLIRMQTATGMTIAQFWQLNCGKNCSSGEKKRFDEDFYQVKNFFFLMKLKRNFQDSLKEIRFDEVIRKFPAPALANQTAENSPFAQMNYDGNNDPVNFMNLLVFLYFFLSSPKNFSQISIIPSLSESPQLLSGSGKEEGELGAVKKKRQMAMEKINSSLNRDYKREIHDVIN